jgi:hypothetical protein
VARKCDLIPLNNGVMAYLIENDKVVSLTFNNMKDAQIVGRVWQTSEPIKVPHSELEIEE